MPTWGWVCIGLTVAGVAFVVYAVLADMLEERRYRRTATSVVGWIVQAHLGAASAGDAAHPATDPGRVRRARSGRDEHLAELAHRAAELKETDPSDPDEAEVVRN